MKNIRIVEFVITFCWSLGSLLSEILETIVEETVRERFEELLVAGLMGEGMRIILKPQLPGRLGS